MKIQPRSVPDFLLRRFNPPFAQDLRLRVRFVWGEGGNEQCLIAVDQGSARLAPDEPFDLTLIFASASVLHAILSDRHKAFDHFLRGEFRSDGGLPLVFPILHAFSG